VLETGHVCLDASMRTCKSMQTPQSHFSGNTRRFTHFSKSRIPEV
jgi:hypothetical protein